MLIDAFTFFNELDLLEARLNFLDPYVDAFVIIESDRTHAGKSKELNYLLNKERYKKFENKIVYKPLVYSSDASKLGPWDYEFAQRDYIAKALDSFSENDFVIVSDLDEIPNPLVFDEAKNIVKSSSSSVARLIQKMYYYNLSVRQNVTWNRCYLSSKKTILDNSATWLRLNDGAHENVEFHHVFNGGWHLSYFMPIDKIVEKMQNFAHQEFNNELYTDKEKIKYRILNGKDPYDRKECECSVIDTKREFDSHFLEIFKKWNIQ